MNDSSNDNDASGPGAVPGAAGSDDSPPAAATHRALESLGYLPAFDGIRFVGVTAFVLGHAGLLTNQRQLIPFGWWMAVDMFFVISGYLITTLLLRERAKYGRISLKAFYVRRATRLYPLVFAAVCIAILQRLLRPDATATPSGWSIVSMTFYFSNFQQLANPADMLNAWGPLWSLSIEEQFYLIWPITLIALLGRTFRLVPPLIFTIVVAVAITAWRVYSWLTLPGGEQWLTSHIDGWRTFYFSTFHRPDGLLIGCAIAIILAMPRRRWIRAIVIVAHRLRHVTVIGAVTVVTAAAWSGHSGWQVCWGLSLFNVLIALVLIELMEFPDSGFAKVLSLRPFRWIGRRSYAIYVLHLLFLMLLVDVMGITNLPGIFAMTAVIIAVCGVSYRFYEDPIRLWGYRISKRITARGLRDSVGPGPSGE